MEFHKSVGYSTWSRKSLEGNAILHEVIWPVPSIKVLNHGPRIVHSSSWKNIWRISGWRHGEQRKDIYPYEEWNDDAPNLYAFFHQNIVTKANPAVENTNSVVFMWPNCILKQYVVCYNRLQMISVFQNKQRTSQCCKARRHRHFAKSRSSNWSQK